MKIFDASDIIRFAVRVEEDGEAFYRKAALAVQSGEVKDLFNSLADAEVGHKKTFQGMLSTIEVSEPAETYEGEYAAYLRDYIDGKVIFTKNAENDIASDAKDILPAITFAMGREADSILYYHEAKRFIGSKHYHVIDAIIEEERKHFSQLAELKKKYT